MEKKIDEKAHKYINGDYKCKSGDYKYISGDYKCKYGNGDYKINNPKGNTIHRNIPQQRNSEMTGHFMNKYGILRDLIDTQDDTYYDSECRSDKNRSQCTTKENKTPESADPPKSILKNVKIEVEITSQKR